VKDARAVAGERVRMSGLERRDEAAAARTLGDYIALTKPRLNGLVVATSAAGYYLGTSSNGALNLPAMAAAVAGTALVAGGAAALNQVYERDTDALMRRTRMRPVPDGRVPPADARMFGLLLSAAGLALLGARTNVLATALALATLLVYLAIYTPMKRRSPMATLVGAVPGALPPLIGWVAAHGRLTPGGGALFVIVFLWQIPHFMAIAWLCRDDYGRAGFPMLPVIEPDGRRTGRQAVGYAAALVPASLIPTLVGLSGLAYAAVALVLGAALLGLAVRFAARRSDSSARWLFLASIAYLPLIWIVMIADKL
jgi:protoheme IX farnesyltransferase